jgi:chitosanase
MNIDANTKQRIIQVIRCFETSKKEGNYGALAFLHDGPGYIQQITYGSSQATEFGNLWRIIDGYCKAGGVHADKLQPYVSRVGKMPSLCKDQAFIALLQAAALDPIMHAAQDEVFARYYFDPAMHFADGEGFVLPLSLLVVYDSWIHSGGIFGFLRQQFAEMTPAHGGDERRWVTQYVNVRHQWLSARYPGTVYRMKAFEQAIEANNWDMAQPINANGIEV